MLVFYDVATINKEHKMEPAYTINLPTDHALVLQQIHDDGVEDFGDLSQELHIGRSRLAHILDALKHKGLISIRNSVYGSSISLSKRGKQYVNALWPQTIAYA